MAVDDRLLEFVGEGLRRGMTKAALSEALLKAGWSEEQVRRGLATYADLDLPIPVPRPLPYLSAREAFIYVVLFTTLYITCFQLGSLVFDLINLALPDPAAPWETEYASQSIRWSVSSLIVAFPIFAYMTWRTAALLRRDPTKRASKIRRNLTYLTLFIAACALIGDVTMLVYNLLGGELTTRFMLKAVTVGVIAGAVFWHYLSGIRTEEREPVL